MGKKEEVINEYLQGKRSLVNTIDDVCDLLQEDIQEAVKKYMDKNLEVEICLSRPNEDFWHEGYYDTIEDAIEGLKYIKEHIDEYCYEDED